MTGSAILDLLIWVVFIVAAVAVLWAAATTAVMFLLSMLARGADLDSDGDAEGDECGDVEDGQR